jgi:hypothetical protein
MNYAEIEVNRHKYESENTPDDELIAAVQRFPEREHGIAAQQVLVGRQRAREQKAAEELRAQHQMSVSVGSKTLRWTIIAAVAAVIGAVAAIIAIFR